MGRKAAARRNSDRARSCCPRSRGPGDARRAAVGRFAHRRRSHCEAAGRTFREGRIEVDLRRDDASAAVERLLEAKKLADSWLVRAGLGRAYLAAGAYADAQTEFDVCLKRNGEATAVLLDDIATYRVMPPIRYDMGRAREALKSPAGAESYKTFLSIPGVSPPILNMSVDGSSRIDADILAYRCNRERIGRCRRMGQPLDDEVRGPRSRTGSPRIRPRMPGSVRCC